MDLLGSGLKHVIFLYLPNEPGGMNCVLYSYSLSNFLCVSIEVKMGKKTMLITISQ